MPGLVKILKSFSLISPGLINYHRYVQLFSVLADIYLIINGTSIEIIPVNTTTRINKLYLVL